MARLVNPGLGDCLDRLGILMLKLRHHGHQEHWANEAATLEARTRSAPVRLAMELTVVNAMLWQAEDELRELHAVYPGLEQARGNNAVDITAPLQRVARCAFRIQDLNDSRAALVQQINQQNGDDLGPEKGSGR